MSSKGKIIRVLIAEDHAVMMAGIRATLKYDGGFEVVAETTDGYQAREALQRLVPDVALLDIDMPDLTGLELAEELHRSRSVIRVLLFSGYDDTEYIERALDAGVDGYLLKGEVNPVELGNAIRAVYAGCPVYSWKLTQKLATALGRRQARPNPLISSLTEREQEIMQLVAEGMSNQEIATQLGIALRTAETHRTNLMKKLRVHKASSLTRLAVEQGLLSDPDQSHSS